MPGDSCGRPEHTSCSAFAEPGVLANSGRNACSGQTSCGIHAATGVLAFSRQHLSLFFPRVSRRLFARLETCASDEVHAATGILAFTRHAASLLKNIRRGWLDVFSLRTPPGLCQGGSPSVPLLARNLNLPARAREGSSRRWPSSCVPDVIHTLHAWATGHLAPAAGTILSAPGLRQARLL